MPDVDDDEPDEDEAMLDRVVAAAHEGGLDALTVDETMWLDDWLSGSGDEEFSGHAWDEVSFPEFGPDDAALLDGVVADERLSELEAGATPSAGEVALMQERWLAQLKEEPDDDVVPGIWTCELTSSDGTQIRTTRYCYGNGWERERQLHHIDAL